MTAKEIQALLQKQRNYYNSGATIPIKFRIVQLYETLLHIFLR